jgi:hypothetical protein
VLAGVGHLDAWARRNRERGDELAAAFDTAGIVHNLETTRKVAEHAYHHAALTGASLWTVGGGTVRAGGDWRTVFR